MRKSPSASSPEALKRMRSTRQQNTSAEIALRHALSALGLRYRLHRNVLPGNRRTADIVFPSEQVAVFVDGCFWHCCPMHSTYPKANASWWATKLKANRLRDLDTNRRLRRAGWRVVRVWEHESPNKAAARVASVVRACTPVSKSTTERVIRERIVELG
jgi:DNA mismatch endonuclease, patch repair protein